MNSLLQLLDILTAERFGAASGQLPDSPKSNSELPATHTQADMEPRR